MSKQQFSTRFTQTVNLLLDAINNNTLVRGNCNACAVGNMIAHFAGIKLEYMGLKTVEEYFFISLSGRGTNGNPIPNIMSTPDVKHFRWNYYFETGETREGLVQERNTREEVIMIYGKERADEVLKLILDTGYTVDELAQIEFAFESNSKIPYIEYQKKSQKEIKQDQIKGLSAVIELLKTWETTEEVFNTQTEFVDKVLIPA